jgi:hypothetical protein
LRIQSQFHGDASLVGLLRPSASPSFRFPIGWPELEALTTSSKGNETTAIALLDTYRTVDPSATKITPRMSNENALRESPALAAAGPLTEEDIDSWLSYWKSVSLISF